MKSLRNRLAIHFSLQFILLTIVIVITFVVLFTLLIQFIMNEELKRNFPLGALDAIYTATNVTEDKVEFHEKLKVHLEKMGFWVQVINTEGEVIGSHNTPSKLPNHYTVNEIMQIENTKQFQGFYIYSQLDSTYEKPFLFFLGYKNNHLDMLQNWFLTFSQSGLIKESQVIELEKKLASIHGSLQVLNENGDVIQSIGEEMKEKKYEPLDVLIRSQAPGINENDSVVYNDSASGNTWILQFPRNGEGLSSGSFLGDFIRVFIIIGVAFLVATVGISIWHGFRYGQPLLIFSGWLERMGHGLYDEVLTEKERKKIFRKNGKVRIKYRLYKEVFNAFYQMAEKLASAEKERNRLEKTREEWMTGISHDLRTPLSTIEGYGHLLESGQYTWTEEELKDMGKMIREKGDYMTDLLDDFILAFQLKNNSLPHSFTKSNVNELVRANILKFVNDMTLQDTRFSFQGSEKEVSILADQRWFERMIDNLIFNAIKHNPPGTVISVSLENAGDSVCILIADNGMGIDKETIEHLFDRYYRGTNTDESSKGAGLGMSIAKAIAELHHGTIIVQSKKNTGTTIRLSFPII
ncbi:HAMP domain-containing histidine kinase [Bacillus sp. FJAT-49705]|uniref:histidine kinase n=1 Tax=Cytobacillus citreus TaxID=2833586 RepID=A0ABS5NPE6_9BACI|nr:HAMP domain-containing sensor histidine kinase [Cytobacillus citreus]MBS4189714.1 HAMP domain-containing histidine kinase [Cytobacillus citreus]